MKLLKSTVSRVVSRVVSRDDATDRNGATGKCKNDTAQRISSLRRCDPSRRRVKPFVFARNNYFTAGPAAGPTKNGNGAANFFVAPLRIRCVVA